MESSSRPVLIVGGGPVGLLLAIMLSRAGVRCRVLERSETPDPHFRSIGIHPVALELLDIHGCAAPMIDEGQQIHRGSVSIGRRRIGSVDFREHLPPPFPFILTLPQARTEAILESVLKRLDPDCLRRRVNVTSIHELSDRVVVRCREEGHTGYPEELLIEGSILIGCDGKRSLVRKSMEIPYTGRRYPDTYVMGDFRDRTGLGKNAQIFLHPQGLVESFPLPEGMRRWVVKTDQFQQDHVLRQLCLQVSRRLHIDLDPADSLTRSSFRVHRRIARTFARGRLCLAGDAAHVVSPIGGQGMNLGWLNAAKLASLIGSRSSENSTLTKRQALNYTRAGKRLARRVARRAGFNMWFGRKYQFTLPRLLIVRSMVSRPVEPLMARIFTMQGL